MEYVTKLKQVETKTFETYAPLVEAITSKKSSTCIVLVVSYRSPDLKDSSVSKI